MSRLGIMGASGSLGVHLVGEALTHGWLVHALTRDPSRIKKANENLTVYRGDAEKGEGLDAFVAGCRSIIYAVNSAHPSEGVAHLVKALGKRRLERVVLVSRVGAGDSELQGRKVSGVLASLLPRVRKTFYEEIGEAEGLLRVSGLPYSIFRPTELTDEVPGHHQVAVARADEPPPARVGKADLARFIIQSLEDPKWSLQEVTVGARRH